MKRTTLEIVGATVLAAAAFLIGRNHPFEKEEISSNSQLVANRSLGPALHPTDSPKKTQPLVQASNASPVSLPFINVPAHPDPQGMSILSRPTLIGQDGQLSPAAVRELRLLPEEELLVKQKLTEFHARMEQLAKKNLVKDASRSNPQSGVAAYKIQSFAAEGKSALRDLQKTLGITLGENRAASLVSMYPSANKYGNLGTNDVVVVFQAETTQPDGAKIIPCSIEEYDPITGKKLVTRSGQFESLSNMFGSIFSAHEIE